MDAEHFMVTSFMFLTAAFVWNSMKLYRRGRALEDQSRRRLLCQRAIFLLILAFMPLFSALYVVFKSSWMFYIVLLTGIMAAVYVVGSRIKENRK